MNPSSPVLSEIPLEKSMLCDYFVDGIKTADDLQIGIEWEKIGVYRDSGRAIRYSGDRGVEAIFGELIRRFAWEPIYSAGTVIALKKNESSITLEPGGQIELSGRKAASLGDNAREIFCHLSEIRAVSEKLGIVWLGLGLQPVSALDDIEWVPKKRYDIMRRRLPGALTHRMMKQTASIQISLDYVGEDDAVQKLRLAMALAPVFTAIFADSPVSGGVLNGFQSERAHIWSETAPERTGLISRVFDEKFGFRDYVDYALDVPMIFIVRQGEWIAVDGMTFGDFLKKGFRHYQATLADWDLHLTTIFTDVRLKKYIEIRSMDCQKTELGLAAAALVKGLFYSAEALSEAWKLVADASAEERLALAADVARKGLAAPWKGKDLLPVARRLAELAEEGLNRFVVRDGAAEGEAKFLKPLKALLAQGKNPAQILIEKIGPDLPGQAGIQKLIELTAIA